MKKLSETLKTDFTEKLKKLSAAKIGAILNYMENDPVYDYSEYTGAGSYGAVFKASDSSGNKSAVKFQIDDESYSTCKDAWKLYSMVVKGHEQENYIIKMNQPIYQILGKVYFCVIHMEAGFQTNVRLLDPYRSDKEEEDNSHFLLALFKKIITAFIHFNSGYGFYHGDIKTPNLVYVVETDNTIGIRIIDFDLVFPVPFKLCAVNGIDYYTSTTQYKRCNPVNLAYSLPFRPPELKSIVPSVDWSEDQSLQRTQGKNWASYRWNKDFKEEAYAVGKSLQNILKYHEKCYNEISKYGAVLKKIAEDLSKDNIEERSSLPQMLEYIEEADKGLRVIRII